MRRTLPVVILALATWTPAAALTAGQLCEKNAVTAFRSCTKSLMAQQASCLKRTGAPCAAADAKIAQALDRLEDKVLAACPDQATVTAAGYPALLAPAALVTRFQTACGDATASLLARTFGGPNAVARGSAMPDGVACLDHAYGQARKVVDYAFKEQSKCVLSAHAGKACDPAAVAAKVTSRKAKTVATIVKRCPNLASLIAIDAATYVDRSVEPVDCGTAATHGGTAPLVLGCGPRAAVPVPPLATSEKVWLDDATWGTKCGDGSQYGFAIRLAPPGHPVDKIVIHVQGGGSCATGPDCDAQNPMLFTAEEGLGQAGIMSFTNAASPFVDWTKVFLPYCTQDGHVGSGVVNAFPEMTVHRYGAVNLRAAMRYVRDVLWAAMDATDPEGFRPDRLTVLFSGSSAGGQGVQFNYHYLLDELRWQHTTLVPDSALGMDNGGLRVAEVAFALGPPPGWGGLAMAPPYCFDATCGVAWNDLLFATSARLSPAIPQQQMLSITNQVDATQRNGSYFASNGEFVNALRARYCEHQGAPGVHDFLSATSASEHGNINESSLYNNLTIGGTRLRDWLGQAMNAPATLTDKVAQGTIVPDVNGALPFPCAVSSPSGAFLERR